MLRKEDLQPLAKIFTKCYEKFDVGEKWADESSYKLLEYWLHKQPDLAFLAQIEKTIIGAIIVGVKPWWDGNHLVDGEVFVDPNHQKMGVAKELFKKVCETALNKYKVVAFDSYTFKKTGFQLDWYKSIGFTEIEEWTMITADVNNLLENLKK